MSKIVKLRKFMVVSRYLGGVLLMVDSAVSRKNYFLAIIGFFLFIPPFFKGLYFDKHFLWFLLPLLILFTFEYVSQHMGSDKKILRCLNDYVALGFVIIYGLAIADAANYNDALNGFLRVVGYFAVYYLIAYGLRTKNEVDRVLNVLYGSGVVVALVGLGAAFNLYHFAGDLTNGRINSTLQYPNTLAAYLIAVIILGVYLSLNQQLRIGRLTYGLGNYIMFITFMGTESRGGFLVFLFVLPLFLLGPLGKGRYIAWVNTLVAILTAFSVSHKVFTDTSHQTGLLSLTWVLGGAIIVAAISYGISMLIEKINVPEDSRNIKLLVGVVIVSLLGLAVVLLWKGGFLSSLSASRMMTISFENRNVLDRFVFYQDAFRAIKDNLVLGAGGGAWRTLFQEYQSYYYISREIHNYYLQVWLEAGILGLTFLIGIWFAFVKSAVRVLRSKAENRVPGILVWAIVCSALTLGLHGMIDFTFSSGAVAIFLWALIGLVRSLEVINDGEEKYSATKVGTKLFKKDLAVVLALAALLIITTSLSAAVSYSGTASKALQEKDIMNFKLAAEKVVTFNPLNSSYHLYLAQIYSQSGGEQNNKEMIKKALEEADKAVRLNSQDPTVREVRARIYLAMGEVDKGVKEMETALQLQPWYQDRWGILAETYYQAGKYYLDKGEKKKAADYFKKVNDMPARISAQLAKLNPEHKELWILEPKLQTDAYILNLVTKAEAKLRKI